MSATFTATQVQLKPSFRDAAVQCTLLSDPVTSTPKTGHLHFPTFSCGDETRDGTELSDLEDAEVTESPDTSFCASQEARK